MSDRPERLRREAWKWLGMAQQDLTGARYGAIGCGTRWTLVPCSYVRTRPAMYRGPGQAGVRLGWDGHGCREPLRAYSAGLARHGEGRTPGPRVGQPWGKWGCVDAGAFSAPSYGLHQSERTET